MASLLRLGTRGSKLALTQAGMTREDAYRLVQSHAMRSWKEDLNFHDSVFWALPNQRVENVNSLGCNDEIDSLRIFDRPPFAHEPGYAAYMLWAASHLTRAGQTVAVVSSLERAFEASDTGTSRPALPRPRGGMFPYTASYCPALTR